MYTRMHRMNNRDPKAEGPGARSIEGGTEMRPRLDAFVEWLARTLMRVFFREIEVEGLERIPRGVPLVLVANHHNSLIDPALVLGFLGCHARFLAKSTLWKVPGIRQLLVLGGVIPVYRQQDAGEDTSRNEETFARCHETLAAGGAVALFPEGVSHDAPHLARLKTGAARIALEAEARFGPLGVSIVPVGLTFEEKGRFRSRALVHVGEPLDPAPELALHADDPKEAARTLTERVGEALHTVTLNYPSHEEAAAVERAAEILEGPERELPVRMAMAEAFALRRSFLEGYRRVREHAPERIDALRERLAEYEAKLRLHGLRDDQVSSRYPNEEVWLYALGSASLLLFWLPLAAVGTVLNGLPYRLLGVAASLTRTADLPATFKLFGGFFLFPIVWLLWCSLAVASGGWLAGFATALLAPLSGYVAMLFHERHGRLWEEAGAYLWLRLRRGRAAELRAERARLRSEVVDLVALDPQEQKGSEEP